MADIIKYLRIPFPRFPLVKDASDDWNPVRGDYDGGVFAGAFGGYHAHWSEIVSVQSTGEPSTYVATTSVPSGYLYVLQQAALFHGEDATRRVFIFVQGDYPVHIAVNYTGLGQWVPILASGEWVIPEGGEVLGQVDGLSSGYLVKLYVWGYKVRL